MKFIVIGPHLIPAAKIRKGEYFGGQTGDRDSLQLFLGENPKPEIILIGREVGKFMQQLSLDEWRDPSSKNTSVGTDGHPAT